MREHDTGCLVCGEPLLYLEAAEPMCCALCGASRSSSARCAAGHFACDACHSGSANEAVERICAGSESRDPVEIALQAMRHPKVKMHGPEHHFLVPAALLAAWCNATGRTEERAARVAEARRRSGPVTGGFCGIQGACGAAIGVGTFVSIVAGASPLTGEARGLANLATARALELVARTGGARCCKRDSWLSLLAAVRFAKDRLGVDLEGRGPACTFSDRNRECLADDCPFHRPAPGTLPAGAGSHPLEPMPDHPTQADLRIQDATAARYAALAGSTARLSCGAALELADPRPGESLVDLGCGRGRDLLRAAGMVGPAGRVTGVDASPAMLEAATAALDSPRAGPAGGLASVRLVRADLADIDLPDGIADVAISNCAINHAPDKRAVFAEIHRLLRPGGRAVVSDVIAERELPASVREDPAAWAACYGGAVPEAEYLAAIRAAGLVEVEILARTEPYEKGGVEVRSLTVRARRPSQARPSLPGSSGPGPLPEVTP